MHEYVRTTTTDGRTIYYRTDYNHISHSVPVRASFEEINFLQKIGHFGTYKIVVAPDGRWVATDDKGTDLLSHPYFH